MNRFRKNITKKRILSLLMMFTSVAICAQTKLSGVVKDNTGEAMPGVSVVIKGTNIGTVTEPLACRLTARKLCFLSHSWASLRRN